MSNLFGSIFKSFLSNEGPSDNTVTQISITKYLRTPIVAREDCLVLYGPSSGNKYDMLLQKPIEDSRNSAFSLFRDPDVNKAQLKFLSLKEVLVPFIKVIPHIVLNDAALQNICDLMTKYPTWTSAHVAAQCGYTQAFTHPDVTKMADVAEIEVKLTPLHLAVMKQDVSMIHMLLGLKVSVDVVDVKGNSVYHLAASTDKAIIKVVTSVSSTLLNAPNFAGKTPLHLACENDKPDCVKELLIAGADVNVAATHDSALPIHCAINVNSTLCAKEIISMYPNQLYVEDMKHGGTPLHWATSREMINALVDLGCKVNAANFQGSTALHNMVVHKRLSCVIVLASFGADVSAKNQDGNTALHLASTPTILQAILVFGGDPSITNAKGETVRHLIATSSLKDKNHMLYLLHSIGAPRCSTQLSNCNDGCGPRRLYDGVPPEGSTPNSRNRTFFDEFLDDAMNNLIQTPCGFQFPNSTTGGRVLCLDGGGMKGLVLIQLLMVIDRICEGNIKTHFDWICGTSTGGILALAIAMGKDPRYCQGLYFRIKDKVFVGQRPYDEKPLEEILRKEFGETSCMSDIKDIKVCVTGVLADRFPADLHLFRNYSSGEELLSSEKDLRDVPIFDPTRPPDEQLIWHAARASGAAPSYFKAFGRFIDGGLISNNPTLDMMTEIVEYNCVLRALGRAKEAHDIKVVVSLGTGRPPVSKVNTIDMFRPESFFKTIQMAFGLSNMAKLLIDQATMADNRTVDRARAWCGMSGISYLRLSPQLSLDIPLDETNDEVLVNMLWETLVYANSKLPKIQKVVELLKKGCASRQGVFQSHINSPMEVVDVS